ncbi:MAG: hypothetical protein WC543_01395 [Candidatus Omnitrophota bacterium]
MKKNKLFKILSILLCVSFLLQQTGFAQVASVELNLSSRFASAGNALSNVLSPDKFRPVHLRSISYDQLNNNFKLLIDKGDTKNPKTQELESTTKDLLNYFFVGIALPNSSFWVNLRPDAPTNIIDPLLAQTEVGKILLEADLQLKKDTAEATNPQSPAGKAYWNKLYQKAEELYGNQNVNIPTLTRPWIVPDEIIIRESTNNAYVYKATLKVMLEQDYLKDNSTYSFKDERAKQLNEYSSQIIRQEIIPKLTKEINSAKRYAQLRQVYYSLILAQWFKARNLNNPNNPYTKQIDRKDLTNLKTNTPYSVDTYFNSYKQNFTQGQYNIKEPVYTPYGQVVRSYFSGGFKIGNLIGGIGESIPTLGGGIAQVVPGKVMPNNTYNQSVTIDGDLAQVITGGESLGNSKTVNSTVDKNRIGSRIRDYKRMNQAIENIIKKLEESTPLDQADMEVIGDLKNRLIMKNYLLALELKVSVGDMLIVSNQSGIKFLNTNLSGQDTDFLIAERKARTIRLLIEEGLIGSQDIEALALLYKQDKFVIKKKLLEKLGSNTKEQEDNVSAKLIKIRNKLSVELKKVLEENYKGEKEYNKIKDFVFDFQFGISAPVKKNNLKAKIDADIQALQATKMARIDHKAVGIYKLEEIEQLIFNAKEYLLGLGTISDDEILEVRDKTEDQLKLKFIDNVQKTERMILLKKFLMIIDLFDCQTLSRLNLMGLEKTLPRVKSLLKKLDEIIQKADVHDLSIAALREALDLLEISTKNPDILSGEAFLGRVAELLTQEGQGTLLSIDQIKYYLLIQRSLMNKPEEYIKQLDYNEQQALINKYRFYSQYQTNLKLETLENSWRVDNPEMPLMLVLVLDAEDAIKGKMLETTNRIIKITRGAVPTKNVDGRERSVVNQEGGDELVLFVPRNFDLNNFANKLVEADLNVRVVAAEARLPQGENSEESEVALIKKVYAAISHDTEGIAVVGETHGTVQSADKEIKLLEEKGFYGALLSFEYNKKGDLESFVYYKDEKWRYDDFYARIMKDNGAADVVLTAGDGEKYFHPDINRVVKDGLPPDLVNVSNVSISSQDKLKRYRRQIDGQSYLVIPIVGLLLKAGVLAHIGLGAFYGEPVIYIDSHFQGDQEYDKDIVLDKETVLAHEVFEIKRWEALRRSLGKKPEDMRGWIRANLTQAKAVAERWHQDAPKLAEIYQREWVRNILYDGKLNLILQRILSVAESHKMKLREEFSKLTGLNFKEMIIPEIRIDYGPDEIMGEADIQDNTIRISHYAVKELSYEELYWLIAHELAHFQIELYAPQVPLDQLDILGFLELEFEQLPEEQQNWNKFIIPRFQENPFLKEMLESASQYKEKAADLVAIYLTFMAGINPHVAESTLKKVYSTLKSKQAAYQSHPDRENRLLYLIEEAEEYERSSERSLQQVMGSIYDNDVALVAGPTVGATINNKYDISEIREFADEVAEEFYNELSKLYDELNKHKDLETIEERISSETEKKFDEIVSKKYGGVFLGAGLSGRVYKFVTSKGEAVAVKFFVDPVFFKSNLKKSEVNALLLAKGNPLFQQYITHIEAGDNKVGYIVTKFVDGESFPSKYTSKEWEELGQKDKEDNFKQIRKRILDIPLEHWAQLVSIFESAVNKGIILDTNPNNFKYDKKNGFTVLDYAKYESSWVSNDSLDEVAAIIIAGEELDQIGTENINLVKSKIAQAQELFEVENDVVLAAGPTASIANQKLNRPLILDKNGLVAHGTNAYALVQATDTDRQLRPAKDGEVRFSGESFGSTALNKKGVSVILLNLLANNPLSTVNNYARESASAKDSLVTLDNIKEKIRKINKAIEIKRKEMRSLKKNNVDPAILAWQQYSIDSLESIRPALISAKNKLKIMTKSQYEEYLQLSQIPVCIVGEGISRLPVKSGIRNEGVFEKVNIRVAGVKGEANVAIIKSYLVAKGVNDIIVVELGELEKWVEEYNKKDDASDGEDIELVKNIRKAINPTLAADLSSTPVKVFDPNSKVVNNVAPGGIDFRFLPIITESMGSLKASMRGISLNTLQRIDLTQEWSDIERLVNSGIVPSADRLKEYFAASNLKGNLGNDMQKIVSCISDILRMEEESDTLTNPTLRDMLVVLNSGKSGEELKLAFTN